jgi:hypothetical protein
MNCINVIAYSISAIAMGFEIYGIFMTYRMKDSEPLKIRNSNLDSDARTKDFATLGSSSYSGASSRDIQDELNRIINAYNSSVKKLIESTNEKFKKSYSYFGWIVFGFILQVVSVSLFLLQELTLI